MSNCCPSNVNLIPPTIPPGIIPDPCYPMTPECPWYTPPGTPPEEFNPDCDIMYNLPEIEQGIGGQYRDHIVAVGCTNWYEFKFPPTAEERFLQISVVDHSVDGSGTFTGTLNFQQNNYECIPTTKGYQVSKTAATNTEHASGCILLRDNKAWFKITQDQSMPTSGGYRMSWSSAGYASSIMTMPRLVIGVDSTNTHQIEQSKIQAFPINIPSQQLGKQLRITIEITNQDTYFYKETGFSKTIGKTTMYGDTQLECFTGRTNSGSLVATTDPSDGYCTFDFNSNIYFNLRSRTGGTKQYTLYFKSEWYSPTSGTSISPTTDITSDNDIVTTDSTDVTSDQ